MEKTDKSAIDIILKHTPLTKAEYANYSGSWIVKAMHEYAAQQLSEYKEVIHDLVDYCQKSPYEKSLVTYNNYLLIIDRAKKLIEK